MTSTEAHRKGSPRRRRTTLTGAALSCSRARHPKRLGPCPGPPPSLRTTAWGAACRPTSTPPPPPGLAQGRSAAGGTSLPVPQRGLPHMAHSGHAAGRWGPHEANAGSHRRPRRGAACTVCRLSIQGDSWPLEFCRHCDSRYVWHHGRCCARNPDAFPGSGPDAATDHCPGNCGRWSNLPGFASCCRDCPPCHTTGCAARQRAVRRNRCAEAAARDNHRVSYTPCATVPSRLLRTLAACPAPGTAAADGHHTDLHITRLPFSAEGWRRCLLVIIRAIGGAVPRRRPLPSCSQSETTLGQTCRALHTWFSGRFDPLFEGAPAAPVCDTPGPWGENSLGRDYSLMGLDDFNEVTHSASQGRWRQGEHRALEACPEDCWVCEEHDDGPASCCYHADIPHRDHVCRGGRDLLERRPRHAATSPPLLDGDTPCCELFFDTESLNQITRASILCWQAGSDLLGCAARRERQGRILLCADNGVSYLIADLVPRSGRRPGELP